jgi:LysR family transcriptional regulator, glycine cleavage system transcriptional activator
VPCESTDRRYFDNGRSIPHAGLQSALRREARALHIGGHAQGVPLIHDDSFSSRAVMPSWADWFAAAGVRDADVSRGLRLNSAYHALDATVEGAGMLLAHDALAYDDLRTGRLVAPFDLTLPSGRCYCFVCARKRRESANVRAFLAWLKEEAAAVDWSKRAPRAANSRPAAGSAATG